MKQFCGSDDIVVLNIAGLKFKTRRTTLQRYPDTLLGSAEIEDYYEPERKEYFFDRCRSTFEPILYFYQSNGLICLASSINPDVSVEELKFFKFSKDIVQKFDAVQKVTAQSIEGDYYCSAQKRAWTLFDDPNSSKPAKAIGYLDQLIILLAVAAQCLESLPIFRNGDKDGYFLYSFTVQDAEITLQVIEIVSIAWFTGVFLVRAISCPDKLGFAKSFLNWLDLLAILPFYLELVLLPSQPYLTVLKFFRTIRIVRIFKMSRYFQGLFALGRALKASAGELLLLSLMMATFVVLFSSLIFFTDADWCVNECEGSEANAECLIECQANNPNSFDSVAHGFWWSLVTMSTVGYGDYVPKTGFGKVVGGMCALTGILVISLPFPLIITNFNKFMRFESAKSKYQIYATISDGHGDDIPNLIPEFSGVAYGFCKDELCKNNKDNAYTKVPHEIANIV